MSTPLTAENVAQWLEANPLQARDVMHWLEPVKVLQLLDVHHHLGVAVPDIEELQADHADAVREVDALSAQLILARAALRHSRERLAGLAMAPQPRPASFVNLVQTAWAAILRPTQKGNRDA